MLTPAPRRSLSASGASGAGRRAYLGVHVDRASVLNVLSQVVSRGPVVTERVRDGEAGAAPAPADLPTDSWRVRVTVDDIRDAWDVWLVARDGGAPADRLQDLRDDVDRLVRAAAQQGADDVCRYAVAATPASAASGQPRY